MDKNFKRKTFSSIQDLRAAVLAELMKGGNPFAIPDTLQLPEYQNFSGYDMFFPLNVQVTR